MMSSSNRRMDQRDSKRWLLGWPSAVSYDKSDFDVAKFYSQAGGVTQPSSQSLFSKKKLTDIFMFSMALGKASKLSQDFKSSQDKSMTIDIEFFASQPHYIWMMIATALEETDGDMEIFEHPEKIVNICEKYANYGIKLLMDLDGDADGSRPYKGFEDKFEDLLEQLDEQ